MATHEEMLELFEKASVDIKWLWDNTRPKFYKIRTRKAFKTAQIVFDRKIFEIKAHQFTGSKWSTGAEYNSDAAMALLIIKKAEVIRKSKVDRGK